MFRNYVSIHWHYPIQQVTKNFLWCIFSGGGGGGGLNLDQMGMCHWRLNLSPSFGVGKPRKGIQLWSYHFLLKSIVLYCIVLYCIVLYCTVLYCIGDKDNVYALLI